jgi:GAF domain-containing protein
MDAAEICLELDSRREGGAPLSLLLAGAVELLHDSNPVFDWTGIYELYPDGLLRLGPYVGAATDHVFIAVGQGLCGTAVAERRNINVPDVQAAKNYLACSDSTRSELVVLIRRSETIYAQIDIDSNTRNAFSSRIVAAVEQVADWLAAAFAARELARRS